MCAYNGVIIDRLKLLRITIYPHTSSWRLSTTKQSVAQPSDKARAGRPATISQPMHTNFFRQQLAQTAERGEKDTHGENGPDCFSPRKERLANQVIPVR